MKAVLTQFWNDESGATAMEYGILVAFLAAGLITTLIAFEGSFGGFFNQSAATIDSKAGN